MILETTERPTVPVQGSAVQECDAALLEMLAALPDDLDRFVRFARGQQNWDQLVERAYALGIGSLVLHFARGVDGLLPPEVAAQLERRSFVDRMRQQQLHSATIEAFRALESAEIRAAVLKGPILAERIYPAPWLRASSDVDLLILPEDLDATIAALEGVGYWLGDRAASEAFNRRHHYHLTMLHPKQPFPIEIHFRALRAFGAAMPSRDLLERAVPHETGGTRVLLLEPEDELLYLAVHAAKHFSFQPKWVFDLKLFLRAHQDLNWDMVRKRAAKYGFERGLALSLEDLRRVMDPDAPTLQGSSLGLGRARRWQIEVLRDLHEKAAPRGRLSTVLVLAFSALMADRARVAAAGLGWSCWRIARRRARRYLPWLVPERWSG